MKSTAQLGVFGRGFAQVDCLDECMISRASQPIRSARLSRAAVRIGQNLVWVAIAALFYVVEGAVVVTDLLARVLSPRRPTPVPPSSLDRAVAAKSYAH